MRRPSIPDLLWRLMVSAMVAGLVLLALAVPASGAVGPKLVKDINPTGNSFPTNLTRVGSKLFFAASDGVHGNELWVSDGTTAGTRMVKNIKPGAKSSNPEMLVNVNGTLFFLASDGTHGEQLWKSDGTKAGTVMVPETAVYATDMRPACPGYPYYPPVVAGNRLFYFLSGGGCVLSVTLYVSDGTPAGTHYLDAPVSTNLGDEESGRRVAAALGNKLYFVVENWELDYASDIWVSDGTDAGTHRMAGSGRRSDLEDRRHEARHEAADVDWRASRKPDRGGLHGQAPVFHHPLLGCVEAPLLRSALAERRHGLRHGSSRNH